MNKVKKLVDSIRISGIRFKEDGSQKYDTNVPEITETFQQIIKETNQLIFLVEKLEKDVKKLKEYYTTQKNHFHNIYTNLKNVVTIDQFNDFKRIFRKKNAGNNKI